MVVLAMSFQEDVLHLLFWPKHKYDKGWWRFHWSFLTDEPKAYPPVATDVELTFDKKVITYKLIKFLYLWNKKETNI